MLEDREPTSGPKPPTEAEMAAIVAAVETVWPRPTVEEEVTHGAQGVWKFANRWWGSSIGGRGRPKRPGQFG
jgi:hypothetical protein